MSHESDTSKVVNLSNQQIEILQRQFREYKVLKKKYAESQLSKVVEGSLRAKIVNVAPQKKVVKVSVETTAPSISNFAGDSSTTTFSNDNTVKSEKVEDIPQSVVTKEASDPGKTTLTWQCVNSLLFLGPPKPVAENAIALASSDVGCFLKSAKLPLVLTRPIVSSLREGLLQYGTEAASKSVVVKEGEGMSHVVNPTVVSAVDHWKMQRQLRAAVVQQYVKNSKLDVFSSEESIASGIPSSHLPVSHGIANYASELLPFRNHQRIRKQSRREAKNWERDDRKATLEAEDRRKKLSAEFGRSLVLYRDDFVRYHKNKKLEIMKMARSVKSYVESTDLRKEREERRVEERRLQALKENDMEAYAELLKDTKDGRLKFLLNETDSYINTINQMIQDQRSDALIDDAAINAATLGASGSMSSSYDRSVPAAAPVAAAAVTATSASSDYYSNTHVTRERVVQPAMLVGGELKEYQLQGLQWLVSLYNNNLNGILADEMGLGKTIQAISLLTYLMEFKHNNGPFLVVVPLSTLSNWVNEFNRWAPSVIKVVYKGLPDERKRIFKEEVESAAFNVLLTTYEFVMRDKAALRKLKFQYIIVDEGHRMKNAESKFAQTLGTAYTSKHRILLTGTPLQNNLPELWALLNFLLPTIFSSMDTFDQWFNKPFAAFRSGGGGAAAAAAAGGGDVAADGTTDLSGEERLLIVHRLHEVLRPFMLRRVKSQVLDQLPDKVEKVLRCNLSGWQRKMYHSVTTKGLANKILGEDGLPTTAGGGLNNTIMQLRKVCNHPYLFLRNYVIDEDMVRCSGKFELLDRMLPKLKAAGHRVLMFSQMVELMNVMESFLAMRGFKFLRLDGNTTSDEREKRMFMFNDPDSPYFIFLLSTRAGGLGLNLASADTVVIFDSDWNPMMDAQAQDRAHRIGQRNEVKVFRLITTSGIEERILARANDKLNLTGLVVEAGKFGARENAAAAHSSENKALMESLLNEYSSGGADSFNGGVGSNGGPDYGEDDNGNRAAIDYDAEEDLADDDQLNDMMASYPGELQIYQRMDEARSISKAEALEQMRAYHGLSAPDASITLPKVKPDYGSSSSSSSAAAGAAAVLALQNRLMGAFEIPPWLTIDSWPPRYSVLMHDMMALEPPEPPIKKTKGRKRKIGAERSLDHHSEEVLDFSRSSAGRRNVAYGGEEGGDSDEEEEDDDDDGDGEPVMKAGKIMRARKTIVYDDGMTMKQFSRFVERQEDIATQTAKQSRQQIKTQQQSNAAQRRLDSNIDGTIFQELMRVVKCVQHSKRAEGGGTYLAELFWEKPAKALYPYYYQFIMNPISFKEILAKLRKREYRFFEEIEADFALVSANARMFNLDTSPVFHDAERLRGLFYMLAAPVRLRYGFSSAKPFPPPLPLAGHVVIPVNSYREAISAEIQPVKSAVAVGEEDQTVELEGQVIVLSYADVVDSEDRPPVLKRIKALPSSNLTDATNIGGAAGAAGGSDNMLGSAAAGVKTPAKRGRPFSVNKPGGGAMTEPKPPKPQLLHQHQHHQAADPFAAAAPAMIPRVISGGGLRLSLGGGAGMMKKVISSSQLASNSSSSSYENLPHVGAGPTAGNGAALLPSSSSSSSQQQQQQPRLVLSIGALRASSSSAASGGGAK